MFDSIKNWWRGGDMKLTVACDISPFSSPINREETLIHTIGIKSARRIGRKWVKNHPSGQARILDGHLNWQEA